MIFFNCKVTNTMSFKGF